MNNQTALRPPMGWNSFDCFGWSVTEEEFKSNVDYMEQYLKEYGWEYAVLDFCWYTPGMNSDPNPHQTPDFKPRLAMDEYGRLIPSEDRFPSAADGAGLAPLAAYVHEKGLKFGLHIMRGIPKQAVAENTPVFGSDYHASDFARTDNSCIWLNYMNGLDMKKGGAQEYLDSLFELYADWGVDYIKIDDLSYPYYADEIEGYHLAMERCKRPMVFSTSPGETTLNKAEHISRNAAMWRICADFWDNWEALKSQFERFHNWTPYRGPDSWPDGDMLPLGHISLRGPMKEPRYSNFTKNEAITMMSLWCIGKSPLMMGGNLPDNDEFTKSLLTNRKAIDMNQRGVSPYQLFSSGKSVIWASSGEDGTEKYLALFNLTEEELTISLSLSCIEGMGAGAEAEEIWTGEVRTVSGTMTEIVAAHGARLFVLKAGGRRC